MPLHEYLEQKRRQNVAQLNAIGACHICGSTCRNSQGFNHYFLDGAAAAVEGAGGGAGGMNYNENSMVRPPNLAAMRTCACFGIAPTDPDFCPHSLRVCDRCIEDDKGIGRIRNCGICGSVACDENCGPELLECTDSAEWNNAGCIDCRKMGDFSEMEIFKRQCASAPPHGGRGGGRRGRAGGLDEPRITRVCTKCLEQSTPWVRYDFVCRRFRCETRLVPSDVVERKRFCTFGSSPLNLLPEDGLVAVVDFLSGSDLKQLFLTCSAMCTVAERVAKEKVEKIRDAIPTGPIVIEKRTEGNGQTRSWTHFGGTNDFSLRAPDDEKAWVGIYHYVEKILRETFYFGFQTTGAMADKEVVGRFINQGRSNKFAFGQTYAKREDDLEECPSVGYSVRGGTVLVTGGLSSPVPLVVASSQRLETGIHFVLCRLFCPGSGAARGNRDVQSFKLGSMGILRTNQRGDGPTNDWAQREDVMEPWLKEEVVFGIMYNAENRRLTIHINPNDSRSSRFLSKHYTLDETSGDLYIAAELTSKSASVAQTLLSFRNCDAEEWTKFVEHTRDGAPFPARDFNGTAAADIFDQMEALEVMVDDAQVNPVIDRHQVFREAIRNRRRERDEGMNQHRIHMRMAMEGGRRIGRLLRPRPAIPQMVLGRRAARILDAVAAEEEPAPAAPRPPSNINHDGEVRPAWGRLVRARPFARAAAMAEELHDTDDEDDGNEAIFLQADAAAMAEELHDTDDEDYGDAISPMQDDQLGDLLNADANVE